MNKFKAINSKFRYYFRFPVFNYSFGIICILSLALVTFTFYFQNQIEKEKLSKTKTIATSTAENTKQFVLKILYQGEELLDHAELEINDSKLAHLNLNQIEKNKLYYDILPKEEPYLSIGSTDEFGYYEINSEWYKDPKKINSQKKTSLKDRAYFKFLADHPGDNVILSEPIYGKTTNQWVLVLARRKHSLDTKFKGVVLLTISVKKISDFFALANPESTSTIALYTSKNVLITRYPFIADKIAQKFSVPNEANDSYRGTTQFEGLCPIEHVNKFFAVSYLKDFGIKVLWGTPSSILYNDIRNKFSLVIWGEIFLLFVAGFFLALKYRTLSKLEILQINEANTSRMAMIGEFSSGIAHEINNPLTIINWNTQLLLKKSPEDSEERKSLQKILDTSSRITKTIASLKHLGHSPKTSETISHSFLNIVEDVKQILNLKIENNHIKINYNFKNDLYIKCIPSLLSQVLLNLFSNSTYELMKLEEKWIEISAEEKGNKIYIHFTDSGKGIPLEVRSKLMSTFYTTKPIGEGTGLGLSICKKIIVQQNGEFYLDVNHPNTRFTIVLPKGEAPVDSNEQQKIAV